ncbi:MAG: FAD-dependent oxidoreductase [Pirellulales bacterium]|nr:FAD-dependent oxidoreductase [Pirellulales bacterium]
MVVYGGTSAAVTAAVEAARMGKSVVLVSPDAYLGGMTSNGLGWTDIGNRDTIGGLSREFYGAVYNHYLNPAAWTLETRQAYINRSSLDPDNQRQMMFTFEPKVARAIFDTMIASANVPVMSGRLDRSPTGVTMTDGKIVSIRTEAGSVISGKAFIDATYEGDLMAAAGVSYQVGRESNADFGETHNGIQTTYATKNQLPNGIDPYVIPGDPSSGLLSGVNPNPGGADGSADNRLQAYNYRMVLTNNPANRVAITQPANYQEENYELLFRAIAAEQTGGFFKLDPMPNNKTDSNNTGGISTDYIGGNYNLALGINYAEADYETREAMEADHRDYQLGLVWTLQNSPRVPATIRNNWAAWGLPADEFVDNGHWPRQIYVREARRLQGVVTIHQGDVNQQGELYDDSVGMGGYNMDSHHVQRTVNASGFVKNEGDIQIAPAAGPYPISFRSIVARPGEADNLLVPVALSATHIAYGSIRMEPVFMTLGQSAGAAAALLSDLDISARDVPYALLRSRLVRQEQILGSTYTSADPGIALSFGGVHDGNVNGPGHALGRLPGAIWNLVNGDVTSGIVDTRGEATSLSVDIGKSSPAQQMLDWNAGGFSAITTGSALNTGLYAGNVSSALHVDDGKSSLVDIGVRIRGLSDGIYDAFLTAKNTNTTSIEQFNVYSLVVDASSAATDYSSIAPQLLSNSTGPAWRNQTNMIANTFSITGNQDLVLIVEGITAGELRGFLNTLEIVKLYAPPTADVDGDGMIDLADYQLIRNNLTRRVSLGQYGDANGDGLVDQRDFFLWREKYLEQGGTLSALDGLAAPEPDSLAYAFGLVPLLARMTCFRFSGADGAMVVKGAVERLMTDSAQFDTARQSSK